MAQLVDLLQCPVCHADLRIRDDRYLCKGPDCGSEFPAVDGAPILINERNSIFDIDGFLAKKPTYFKSNGRVRQWVSDRIPDLSGNVTARENFSRLRTLLAERGEKARVLVLGGGIVGAGMDSLLDDGRIEVIETDVAIGPRTQLVCDAHDLPFKNGSMDAVVVQAVLEHVINPTRCVDEIHRVLTPEGLVYADTPFVQQVHGREYDFTRFTRLGHRRLFRRFSEEASGITCGPGMALAWAIQYFLMSFFASRSLRAIASGTARAAFFWLKYFDYFLAGKAAASDAASAFFFLGRKSNEVLSDRELVASYHGGF
jgi:SAM-dependent methyltransferase